MTVRREKNKPQKTLLYQQVTGAMHLQEEKTKDENLIELGKFFYTLASLVFGGAILAVLLDYQDRKFPVLVSSILFMVILVLIGWTLIRRGNIKK
jgi:hypothetical protein